MVAVSLGTAYSADLAVRVEPRERRGRVSQGPDQGPGFTIKVLPVHLQRALAAGAVEDQGGPRGTGQLVLRERHGVPGADHDAVGLLVGELDGGVRGQVRGADQAAFLRT